MVAQSTPIIIGKSVITLLSAKPMHSRASYPVLVEPSYKKLTADGMM